MVKKVALTLTNIRIAYPNLFEAKGFNNQNPKFSCVFLIDQSNTKMVEKISKAINEVTEMEWPDLTKRPKLKDKISFKDGNEQKYAGYKDSYYISANNSLRPVILNENKEITTNTDLIHGGDYVHAIIEFWAQNNKFGQRINCNLVKVMFAKKGERFSKKVDFDDELFE